MIMLKTNVLKTIKETVQSHKDKDFNREEKFQIFCYVCDNLLKEGRISKAQHKHWTNVF